MDREKALEMAVGQITKQYGKGAVMKMSQAAHGRHEVISTGALSLDVALGIGGDAAGESGRDFRSREFGKDHSCSPCGGGGATQRGNSRFRGRRALP